MGGYGSGRQGTKSTVEDCLSVDANFYARRKFFKPGAWGGTWRWTRGEQEVGSYALLTVINDDRAVCIFLFNKRKVPVDLTWYSPGLGGRRYFFHCPLCERRMRTLHFKGGEIACRLCHNLTYESCNKSHYYDSLFKRMAQGDRKHSWQEYARSVAMIKRIMAKGPKRPRGRPKSEKTD